MWVRGPGRWSNSSSDRPAAQSIAFAAWVTHDAAQAALSRAGLNLDSLTRAAARREFRPVATGINVAVEVTSALASVRSENVVARIPGATPALTRQAVLFTAHWITRGSARRQRRLDIQWCGGQRRRASRRCSAPPKY